jgi:transposase-like protein
MGRVTRDAAKDERLVAAYRAWDPAVESVEELCGRLGTTRATLYNTLHRNDEPLKTRPAGKGRDTAMGPHRTQDYLLSKLVASEVELERLREEVRLLRAENAGLRGGVVDDRRVPGGPELLDPR